MKTLFTFKVTKDKETEVPVETVENGSKVVRHEKKKISVEKEYAIRMPGRAMYDAADVFFTVENSSFMKMGVLSQVQMKNLMENTSPLLSKEDQKLLDEAQDLVKNLGAESDDLIKEKAATGVSTVRVRDIDERLKEINLEMLLCNRRLDNLYMTQNRIFENSSESKARQKTINLWTLSLAAKRDGNDYIEMFNAKDFKGKEKQYDALVDGDDENDKEAILVIMRLVVNWYYSNFMLTRDQFQKSFNDVMGIVPEQPKTEEKAVETPETKEDKEAVAEAQATVA